MPTFRVHLTFDVVAWGEDELSARRKAEQLVRHGCGHVEHSEIEPLEKVEDEESPGMSPGARGA